MKFDVVDINATRKSVRVEIPSDAVDAEIDRIARDYSRKARVPGFRPGKTPPRVIKQRFKDQILHDVAHDLIPRAVDDALREKGLEAVDTPDVREVNIEEGRPLTFTASFDTVPEFDPGDLAPSRSRAPRARSTTKRSNRRFSGCATAARATSRSKGEALITATRSRSISNGATRAAPPIPTRTSISSSAPRRTRQDSTSSSWDSKPAPRKNSRSTTPPTTRLGSSPTPTFRIKWPSRV